MHGRPRIGPDQWINGHTNTRLTKENTYVNG